MKNTKENTKEKITNFIRYHNGFVIGLVFVFIFAAGSFAANEDIRDAVVGEEIITETGIDNSQLLSADLHNFDVGLTINYVSEDEKSYYIDYSFSTIAVQDNIWKPIVKLEKFTVSKEGLGNRDLGLYLTEELGEVASEEIIYLKEAQKTEKERGETKVVKTNEYSGLIGLVLDVKNKILPGYEPVVIPPGPVAVPIVPIDNLPAPPVPEPIVPMESVEPVAPDPIFGCMDSTATNYNSDATEDDGTCEYPADEPAEPPADALVCDADNLDLCGTQEKCERISLYWYNDICNLENEIPAEKPPAGKSPADESSANEQPAEPEL